ncbi:Pentapeptide repeat protein [Coleofasciculus chthonoplastes PCC 7420]|uniref:Pentapeptide repeat protein n=2 Tax=Coleofasciculus chthonoplastes TaxID=64178 RepID=B4VMN7_9CYAN|nr:Pentapeptide repeat protein [Coleofasciculus chthonoplastes PCC 7420]
MSNDFMSPQTNEDYLALLRQGVEVWNAWKAHHPDIRPNLSFATGKGVAIQGAKLSGVDLSRANLSQADLSKADLIGANLSEAYLSEAYLSEADLIGANLTAADLRNADLISANLIGANLNNIYLSGADLTKANLSGADLVGAKLIGAKLSGTNLSGANLSGANLSGAHLVGANLRGTNLKGANCSQANLRGVNLQRCKAFNTDFHQAIFTAACLEDWHINSGTNLAEVICEYVYLQTNQHERCPHQGTFAPGEFTRVFQVPLETVNLTFRNGIDWQAFFAAFQACQVQDGSNILTIQSLENRPDGVLTIRIAIPIDANRLEVEHFLNREYDAQLEVIDKDYRYQLQVKYEQVATYRQQSANLTEILQRLAEKTVNPAQTINVEARRLVEPLTPYPSNQGESMENCPSGNSAIAPAYTLEQKQRLTDTATKIQKLLQQLDQTYPTNTPLEKQRVVIEVLERIEQNPMLKASVVEGLKGVQTEVLKELIDHPLVNVLLAALEEYQTIH